MDPVTIPLGALDLVRAPLGAPPHGGTRDGALAAAVNLRPVTGGYAPVRKPVRTAAGITGVLSGHFQIRQTTNGAREGLAGALRRWVVLTDRGLYLASEDGIETALLESLPRSGTRRASFAQMGASVVVTVRDVDREGAWVPVFTYLVGDLAARPLGGIPSGDLRYAGTTGTRVMAYRSALVFKDGSVGPPGLLRFALVPDEAFGMSWTAGQTVGGPEGVGVPASWRALTEGVVVLASFGTTSEAALAVTPGELLRFSWAQIDAGGTMTAAARNGLGLELVDDDLLTGHRLSAVSCSTYNKRLLLAGAAYDFRPPLVVRPAGPVAEGPPGSVRVAVRIETAGGTFWRVSEAFPCEADDDLSLTPGSATEVASYPDRRATEMRVYRTLGPDAFEEVARVSLKPALGQNLAWAATVQVEPVSGSGATMPTWEAGETDARRIDFDPNRLLVSDTLYAEVVRARGAFEVGDGPEDGLLAVLAQGEPVSDGQFGEYPLTAVCRGSAWSLAVGTGDVFLVDKVPLSVGRGVPAVESALSMKSGVVLATPSGLYDARTGGTDVPVSEPVMDADLRDTLADGAALGWLRGPAGDEVWISVPAHAETYCYVVGAGRWYTRSLNRRGWLQAGGRLVGIDEAGALWFEDAGGTEDGRLATAPLALGDAGGATLRVRRARVNHGGSVAGEVLLLDGADRWPYAKELGTSEALDGRLRAVATPVGSLDAVRVEVVVDAGSEDLLLTEVQVEGEARYRHRIR